MSRTGFPRPFVGQVLPPAHWRPIGLRESRKALRSPSRPRSFRVCAGFFDDLDRWRRQVKQRLRAAKFGAVDIAEAAKSRLMEGPAMQLVLLVQRLVNPIVSFRSNLDTKWDQFIIGYDDFCTQETKRLWFFKTEYAEEMNFWSDLLHSVYAFIITLLYQLLVPPGIVRSVLIPLFVGFVWYEHWLTSPMALATLVMAPLKFWPGCPVTWL